MIVRNVGGQNELVIRLEFTQLVNSLKMKKMGVIILVLI